MASLKSFTSKPRFFQRKKGYENSTALCEKCRAHQIVIGAKWGCDYFIFTNVLAKRKTELIDVHVHMWCEVDSPPMCLRAFEEAGFVDE